MISPRFEVKIKNIWNHHQATSWLYNHVPGSSKWSPKSDLFRAWKRDLHLGNQLGHFEQAGKL